MVPDKKKLTWVGSIFCGSGWVSHLWFGFWIWKISPKIVKFFDFFPFMLVMGPGQNFLTWVGSGQFFVAQVGSGQPFVVWVWIWKFSPKNTKFFNFFPFESKKIALGRIVPGSKPGQPLIYCGSKVSSGRVRAHLYFRSKNISLGQVKKYPGQSWVGLLFTAGQKSIGLGQGPSLIQTYFLF